MSLDLTNSNQLDDDFSNYVIVGVGTINRNKPYAKNIIPNRLPSGDRLEDEFGGSARYPRFSEMNDFRDGIPAKIASVGDTDYEYTPYGYNTEYSYSSAEGEEYSNFRFLGIGKRTKKQEERKQRRKDIREGKIDSKGRHAIAKFNPAFMSMRTAILSLIRLNVLGLASGFAGMKDTDETKYNQIKTKWYNWGGSKKSWDKSVSKGKNKKKAFLKLLKGKGKKGFDGSYDLDDYLNADGTGKAKAAKTLLVASSGLGLLSAILLAIPDTTGTTKVVAGWTGLAGTGMGAMGGIIKAFAKDAGASDADVKDVPENDDPPPPPIPTDDEQLNKIADDATDSDDDGNRAGKTILGIPSTAFYIGVGVISLVGGYFIYKKFIAKK